MGSLLLKMRDSVFPVHSWPACAVLSEGPRVGFLVMYSWHMLTITWDTWEDYPLSCPKLAVWKTLGNALSFYFWGNSACDGLLALFGRQSAILTAFLICTNQGTISPRLTSISQSKFLPLFVDSVTGGAPHKSPVSCSWFPWDPVHTDPGAN